jgi:hypothetical protein
MGWSEKYKKSIDCDNPKGFSQRSHCQGRRKKLKEQFKSFKTVEQIAKKHRLDVSFIQRQLDMGEPIEHEHTKDHKLAMEIALQHLDEIPDYYTRLKKMEASAKKEHKKFKDAPVSEGTLHHWYQGSRSKGGKPGWVQPDGSPCANEPGETKTPKCFSSARLRSLKKKGKKGISLIRSAVRRKRQKDKGQQAKSGAAAPTNVPTFAKGKKDPNYVKAEPGIKEAMELNEARKDKPGKGSGTKDACYHKVKSRYDVWPSAYASGALVKCRRVGASNWGNKSESLNYDWDTPIRERPDRYCPKCQKLELRSECKYGPKYWDMFSLPAELISSKKDFNTTMPHPGNMPEGYDHEYSMARSEISTIISAAKRLRKKMAKGEGNVEAWVQSKITKAADYLDSAADYVDSGEMKEQVADTNAMSDKKPFDVAVKKIMDRKDKMTPKQRIIALKQAGKFQGVDEQMLPPINPEKHKQLQKTQKLYNKGASTDNPHEKEIFLKRTGPQLPLAKRETKTQVAHYEPEGEVIDEKCWPGYKKKGMKTMFGKRYPNCVKSEEFSNWRADFGLSEDWQKVNRKDKTDGLSQAAVDAYRRENPGSKLQTAVTEKKPKGKRAKRRANFCRRMKGMKSKLTSAKTARDPDSRINKALRRWNCN